MLASVLLIDERLCLTFLRWGHPTVRCVIPGRPHRIGHSANSRPWTCQSLICDGDGDISSHRLILTSIVSMVAFNTSNLAPNISWGIFERFLTNDHAQTTMLLLCQGARYLCEKANDSAHGRSYRKDISSSGATGQIHAERPRSRE